MEGQVLKLISFISYLIFSVSLILGRVIKNKNMNDNVQEVTKHIEQHQDNASSYVFQQIEKIQQIQMKSFPLILQTSLSQFRTSLGQLLINQTSKRPTEED